MRVLLTVISCLASAMFAFAQVGAMPSSPSSIVFITSTSDLSMDYQLLQTFEARWREREPLAVILPYPLAPYAFPLTPKANELNVAAITERLGGKDPTLIVAQGDPAFFLSLQLRDTRFPDSPIIAFDVVGNETRRKQFEGDESLYVVVLSEVGEKNVEFAARLFPKRKRAVLLLFVGEELEQADIIHRRFSALFPDLSIVTLPNPSQDSADPVLRESPENTFVVGFSPGWIDSSGRYRSGKDYVRSITDTYNVPMFEYLPSNMDGGTVGGVGLSPKRWGREAADRGLALIFDGKEPEHWVAGGQYTTAFADYRELLRFGSSPKLLPPDAELINEPPSAWIRYQKILEPLLITLILAVVALILRTVIKHREKKLLVAANERLEQEVEERTRELRSSNEELEASNAGLLESVRRIENMQAKQIADTRDLVLGRVAIGLAHEINTPLAAIKAEAYIAKSVLQGDERGLFTALAKMDEERTALFYDLLPALSERWAGIEEENRPSRLADFQEHLRSLGLHPDRELVEVLVEADLDSVQDEKLLILCLPANRELVDCLYSASILYRGREVINVAADRIAQVVETVRGYARDSAPDDSGAIASIEKSMEQAFYILPEAMRAGITTTMRIDADLPSVPVLPSHLVRVWVNLIQNALQAMAGKGELEIRGMRANDSVIVEVADSGPGVDPILQDKLFTPFAISDDSRQGMGLGLSICKRIVERSGGSISYEERDGRTIFSVRLPCLER